MSTGGPFYTEEENRRLLREYEALPKIPRHGEETRIRHPDIRPEWVMHIIRDPHDQWEETARNGERRTILVGRVPQFNQWIGVVFVGDSTTGALLTAYPDRRLARKYGGRPWRNVQ